MTSSNPPNITHSHCMVPNMFANPLLNYGFWGVLNTMILSNAVGYILPMSLFQKGKRLWSRHKVHLDNHGR